MWVRDFLAMHPVFRLEEFKAAHEKLGSANEQTFHALLAYHVRQGNILRIRRGLLASVPAGYGPDTVPVDPFLLTMGLSDDAVVAFHAALQFHGRAHSVHSRYHYLTFARRRPFTFRSQDFVPVSGGVPDWQVGTDNGVVEERHAGGAVRVTTLERTLVDVMTLPQHGGGWEEVYRSLDAVEFLDVDRVVEDASRREALTAARVGFYLEGRSESLLVDDAHLSQLQKRSPRQPWYMGPGRRSGGRLVKRWNLLVPEAILERRWEEPT
jgi:predicted transcriptional regulator of viral defense system